MIPPALLDAGDDPSLRGAPLAVLVWLWGQLEPHGYRTVMIDTLSSALHIKRHTAGKAMRILVQRGYLSEGETVGHKRRFRLLMTRNRLDVPLNGHSRAS